MVLEEYSSLAGYNKIIIDLVCRFVRTPVFLVRYLPSLHEEKITGEIMEEAFDGAGSKLRKILVDFCRFLSERCNEKERIDYVRFADSIQVGSHTAKSIEKTYSYDEKLWLGGSDFAVISPNVRLVNGSSSPDTRQKLMKCFNTPFYPEILISSSVLSEGVDLHLNCRHVIHHDLCWNPSTLEQRTGRVDRINSLAEREGKPIHVYLPYISETQDEKMYRVVMDRERWFKVVMGEKFRTDAKSIDKIADRLPLPPSVADALMFRLDVFDNQGKSDLMLEQDIARVMI